ncbi:condensin complex subunit SMC2 [Vararia minispora EC-137]|uniref:Condensin complex subunit SMC2 n=1 Tax=Vararia minispora EC-137 TaxID=1314806 RepID=A0ACB8QSV2_9AGAM|nr:condensin complex subunit SMC2 [Vararia minispora EC-137]
MHIQELIIEGFKSYPVRTQITGWDPSFNAITGLNGSGKSNILDAICFVLGLTKTDLMRAQNQQDLIYKRGQAGITKASVTIVFDNSDKSKSPDGYANSTQITVTRQIALPNISKYLVNGHKSQQNLVHRLFQSVQLNINNPNFLIMQGKITKVLNMKPQEILGMVEEAAGTRTFEERKENAKRTMGKKDKDIRNYTSLLQEEITPKLDKLREEKKAYLQWQKATKELERVGRTLRAFEWTDYTRRVQQRQGELEKMAKGIKEVDKRKERLQGEVEAAEAEAERVRKARDKELKKGGKFAKMEEELLELKKDETRSQVAIEGQETDIQGELKKISDLQAEQKELEDALIKKQKEVDRRTKEHTLVKDSHAAAQAAVQRDEELLQTLRTGVSGPSNNTGGGYMGQLADAQARLAQAETEEAQLKGKLAMNEAELRTQHARFKQVEKEVSQGARALEAKKAELEKMRQKAGSSGWSAEKLRQKEAALQSAHADVRQFTQEREFMKSRLNQLEFNYSDPGPPFDARKVRGLVATLISIDKENYNKSTALEIAAGSKLYNVVVEDAETGKQLLKGGRMRKRVTMIPLNQIRGFRITAEKLAKAQSLAPGKVNSALSIVGYPEDVAQAMAFVFSDTLICDDAATAKAVTFHKDIRVRSVTLEGDVYDPSGMLSGGAAPQSSGVLIECQKLLELQNKVQAAERRAYDLLREEERERPQREQWRSLSQQLEIKEHEVRLLEEQLHGSNASRIGAQLEELKKAVNDLQEELKDAHEKQTAAKADISRLQKDMAEFKNNKEGKTEELRASIVKQKGVLQKQIVEVKLRHKDLQTVTLERDQITEDIERARENVYVAQQNVEKSRKQLEKKRGEHAKLTEAAATAEKKLKEERATLSRFDDELNDLENTVKGKKDEITKTELEKTKLEHDMQVAAKDKSSLEKAIVNLEKQYPWIPEEKHLFGKECTPFDFKENLDALRERAEGLETQTRAQSKKVNTKVMSQLERDEQKEADITRKLDSVLTDRKRIEDTVAELDRLKRDTLLKTWEKVNGDFGQIFAELLPGNFCKLETPEGKDIMDGLEIKVRLGSVWKQSLTELSGGQRSLIALSLIMALLQFKPAPVYILDEIDAALDLSHTQNIGTLFRTRFKGAQFIVVSLKEGLFTNANVLFKTRFRDGTSVVERTAARSDSRLYATEGPSAVVQRRTGGRR